MGFEAPKNCGILSNSPMGNSTPWIRKFGVRGLYTPLIPVERWASVIFVSQFSAVFFPGLNEHTGIEG